MIDYKSFSIEELKDKYLLEKYGITKETIINIIEYPPDEDQDVYVNIYYWC
tara:strand:+ start:81 stop:233 length:153 start_codon:yes stop_codon:yes gene_type:complete